METTTTVRCGKCAGSGKYYFRTGAVEACYPCNGSGSVDAPKPGSAGGVCRPIDAERAELDLRAILGNARAGRCEWSDVSGEDRSCMYVPGQFGRYLDVVSPKAREAFRALGWPV